MQNRPGALPSLFGFHGGDEGIRTLGPHVANVMLSQLSYIPTGYAPEAQGSILHLLQGFVKRRNARIPLRRKTHTEANAPPGYTVRKDASGIRRTAHRQEAAMLNRDALTQAGIDVDEALERVMGNEMLLERVLGMYLNDTHFEQLREAVAANDADGAIAAVHSLKGTSGNLSMKPLFELANKQLALFRTGSWDEAVALMPQLEEAHRAMVAAVEARSL